MTYEYKVEPLDYAAIEAMIRRARAEQATYLGQWIARGARAAGRGLKALAAPIVGLYRSDRRWSGTQAETALRKWAGRY